MAYKGELMIKSLNKIKKLINSYRIYYNKKKQAITAFIKSDVTDFLSVPERIEQMEKLGVKTVAALKRKLLDNNYWLYSNEEYMELADIIDSEDKEKGPVRKIAQGKKSMI